MGSGSESTFFFSLEMDVGQLTSISQNCCWCRHWECCEQGGFADSLAHDKANNRTIAHSAFSAFFCPFVIYFVGFLSDSTSSGT